MAAPSRLCRRASPTATPPPTCAAPRRCAPGGREPPDVLRGVPLGAEVGGRRACCCSDPPTLPLNTPRTRVASGVASLPIVHPCAQAFLHALVARLPRLPRLRSRRLTRAVARVVCGEPSYKIAHPPSPLRRLTLSRRWLPALCLPRLASPGVRACVQVSPRCTASRTAHGRRRQPAPPLP